MIGVFSLRPCSFSVAMWLLLLLASSASSQSTSITDATSKYVASSESTYDHMVKLEDNLWFHWNDIRGDRFMGRLVHIADSFDQAPSWLGFGVYKDNHVYTDLPSASTPFMVGSTAIIGTVGTPEVSSPAQHYHLTSQSSEGITLVTPDDDSGYTDATIVHHAQDDATVFTDLSFTKGLNGEQSGQLRRDGTNIFLWAVGPPEGKSSGTTLGKHALKGVIFLDLAAVQKQVEGKATGSYSAGRVSEEDGDNPAPVIRGKCGSTLLEGSDAGQIDLTQQLQFHWKVVGRGTKVQIALSYTGAEAWLGVATSTNGRMVGSSAIIGAADNGSGDGLGFPPTHYNLNDQDISGVTADSSVLLEEASITSAPSTTDASQTTTVLKFTKSLNDPNDAIPIAPGLTTFLYAVGASRELAYHEHRGAFQLDLEDCGGTIVAAGTFTRYSIFIAHGFLATLAWALATPFAVTVAWFRTLVPASWIYIHVFANVFTFLATVAAFVIVIIGVSKEDATDHFSKTHHYVGLVLVFFAAFQVVNGFLRPPVQRKDSVRFENTPQDTIIGIIPIPRTPRETWQLMHRLSGLAAIGMGIYQVQSGLALYAMQFRTQSMVMYYWIYVFLFFAGVIGLKIWVYYEEDKARRGVMHAVSTSEPSGGFEDVLPHHHEDDDVGEESSPTKEMELSSTQVPAVMKGTLS